MHPQLNKYVRKNNFNMLLIVYVLPGLTLSKTLAYRRRKGCGDEATDT